jgi:hypothetical protein
MVLKLEKTKEFVLQTIALLSASCNWGRDKHGGVSVIEEEFPDFKEPIITEHYNTNRNSLKSSKPNSNEKAAHNFDDFLRAMIDSFYAIFFEKICDKFDPFKIKFSEEIRTEANIILSNLKKLQEALQLEFEKSLKVNEKQAEQNGTVKPTNLSQLQRMSESFERKLDMRRFENLGDNLLQHMMFECERILNCELSILKTDITGKVAQKYEKLQRLGASSSGDSRLEEDPHVIADTVEKVLSIMKDRVLKDLGVSQWWSEDVMRPHKVNVEAAKKDREAQTLSSRENYIKKLDALKEKHKNNNRQFFEQQEWEKTQKQWEEDEKFFDEFLKREKNRYAHLLRRATALGKLEWGEILPKEMLKKHIEQWLAKFVMNKLGKGGDEAKTFVHYSLWKSLMKKDTQIAVRASALNLSNGESFDEGRDWKLVATYIEKHTKVALGFLAQVWGQVASEVAETDGNTNEEIRRLFRARIQTGLGISSRLFEGLMIWGNCQSFENHPLVQSFIKSKMDPDGKSLPAKPGDPEMEYTYKVLLGQFN